LEDIDSLVRSYSGHLRNPGDDSDELWLYIFGGKNLQAVAGVMQT